MTLLDLSWFIEILDAPPVLWGLMVSVVLCVVGPELRAYIARRRRNRAQPAEVIVDLPLPSGPIGLRCGAGQVSIVDHGTNTVLASVLWQIREGDRVQLEQTGSRYVVTVYDDPDDPEQPGTPILSWTRCEHEENL